MNTVVSPIVSDMLHVYIGLGNKEFASELTLVALS